MSDPIVRAWRGALVAAALLAGPAAWAGGPITPATVFTANTGADSVSVLDGATLLPVHADVPTDVLPEALALSPDGTRLFTANVATDLEGRSSITTIDATTAMALKTDDFDTGNGLSDIVVAPDGAIVYATYSRRASAVAYDPVTSAAPSVDLPDIPAITNGNPDPKAIDILPDGSALFILDAVDGVVVKILTSDGTSPANATVPTTAEELRVSRDGATLIVVGDGAPLFFSTDTLTPIAGASTAAIGPQVDVVASGASFLVLNAAFTGAPDTTFGIQPAGAASDPSIDEYEASTGGYLRSIDLGSGKSVLGIAVRADATTAFVSYTATGIDGAVVAVNLASGTLGPTGTTGATPRRVVVREAGIAPTEVVSYFLPKTVAVKLAGAGKDALVAAGFFDDGGLAPDYTQAVTVDVGGFSETFTLVPNAKHTAYTFKGTRLRFAMVPNLRGSSRGRFRMKIAKTTLGGLVDPDQPVDFHFHASGLLDAQGRVTLTAGKYRLGKKRGALLLPPFFPARATATLGGQGLDRLTFVGGFATNGTTPASLGSVTFALGALSEVLTGSAFTKTGDKFAFSSSQGKTRVSILLDFLRETVTVKASKVELGDLAGPTADVLFDAGAGAGPIRTTVRLGSKRAKRFY